MARWIERSIARCLICACGATLASRAERTIHQLTRTILVARFYHVVFT